MPRPRFKKEPCDCLDCKDPASAGSTAQQGATKHAAALQDPPPKCLVLFSDGALLRAASADTIATETFSAVELRSSLDDTSHPHLDGMARDGCNGLLAIESTLPGSHQPPVLDRLAQLFGLNAGNRQRSDSPPDLANRFKQLSAAFASNDSSAVNLAQWAGFRQSMPLQQLVEGQPFAQPALSDLPAPEAVAAAAVDLLGWRGGGNGAGSLAAAATPPQQPDWESDNVMDLLMVHIGASDTAAAAVGRLQESAADCSSERFADACALVEWTDGVVQHLNATSGVRESLLLVVLLGSDGRPLGPLLHPGASSGAPAGSGSSSGEAPRAAASGSGHQQCATLSSSLRPRQSFQLCRDQPVQVEMHAPLLCAQRLPAVVRVDTCRKMDVAEAARSGGDSAILAQRLLPSLAYKLGRAPKYGA